MMGVANTIVADVDAGEGDAGDAGDAFIIGDATIATDAAIGAATDGDVVVAAVAICF